MMNYAKMLEIITVQQEAKRLEFNAVLHSPFDMPFARLPVGSESPEWQPLLFAVPPVIENR